MKENTNLKVVGQITDKIYDTKGNLIETREGHNLVVTSILPLLASLLKKDSNFTGLQYWAIGQGDSSWDTTLPDPTVGDTQLVSELGRVAIPDTDVTYLDDNLSPSNTPTHILQIRHTFDENTLNGTWREFGIFGGNASATLGSGIMLNHRNHARLDKTSEMIVERTMRFTLTLV